AEAAAERDFAVGRFADLLRRAIFVGAAIDFHEARDALAAGAGLAARAVAGGAAGAQLGVAAAAVGAAVGAPVDRTIGRGERGGETEGENEAAHSFGDTSRPPGLSLIQTAHQAAATAARARPRRAGARKLRWCAIVAPAAGALLQREGAADARGELHGHAEVVLLVDQDGAAAGRRRGAVEDVAGEPTPRVDADGEGDVHVVAELLAR